MCFDFTVDWLLRCMQAGIAPVSSLLVRTSFRLDRICTRLSNVVPPVATVVPPGVRWIFLHVIIPSPNFVFRWSRVGRCTEHPVVPHWCRAPDGASLSFEDDLAGDVGRF
jgi:hypothetical protein